MCFTNCQNLYEIPYEVLMEKVGYPIPKTPEEDNKNPRVLRRIGTITNEEEEALLQYLAFIRNQKKKK